MAPPKRRRRNPAPTITIDWTLPADLLLEIVALSDAATLVRCTATCRSLRRDILSASFIRRVTQQGGIAPNVLAYLHTRPMRNRNRDLVPLVSLVHPATPAASRFTNGSMAPYIRSRALSLLRRYNPVTSRGGLVVLRRRRDIKWSDTSEHCSHDLCVYSLMDGVIAYLPDPPDLDPNWYYHTYVLLTAADGIGCSFQLLGAAQDNPYSKNGGCRIKLQMANPSEVGGTTWGPLTSYGHRRRSYGSLQECREAVVLQGGIVHWLLSDVERILTFDIHTKRMGTVKLPPTNCVGFQRILRTSTDGRRLQLLTAERFMISIWVKLSDGWARDAVIDTEDMLRSLHPSITPDRMRIEFERSGESSGVVLLRAYRDNMLPRLGPLIVLDLETKEMRKQDRHPSILFEVDLSARLRSMKIFS